MNAQYVTIRNLRIGDGIPKICVPVVEDSLPKIPDAIQRVMQDRPDLIELRMDWVEQMPEKAELFSLLQDVRSRIGDTVLLFTVRTAREGGKAAWTVEEYERIGNWACDSGCVDLLDVEVFLQEGLLQRMARMAHAKGVRVVASNHDFEKTPDREELVRRLRLMRSLDADISKIAVMPQTQEDVLTLLAATLEYRRGTPSGPVITMSMGGMGAVTRLMGEMFGSAVTFASEGRSSAPGQMPVEAVREVLSLLHEYKI